MACLVGSSHKNIHNSRGSTCKVAALRASAVVMAAPSGVVVVVAAAAVETRYAEARHAKPSHASQSKEGLKNDPKIVCHQKVSHMAPFGILEAVFSMFFRCLYFRVGPLAQKWRNIEGPSSNLSPNGTQVQIWAIV